MAKPPHSGASKGGDPPNKAPSAEDLLKEQPTTIRYFNDAEARHFRKEVVDQDALKWAQALQALPSSQLRRFYADVTTTSRRLQLEENLPEDFVQTRMAMLKAKAAYAYGRNKDKKKMDVMAELVRFFRSHAAAIEREKDFRAFVQHFEAVVAFHTFLNADEKR